MKIFTIPGPQNNPASHLWGWTATVPMLNPASADSTWLTSCRLIGFSKHWRVVRSYRHCVYKKLDKSISGLFHKCSFCYCKSFQNQSVVEVTWGDKNSEKYLKEEKSVGKNGFINRSIPIEHNGTFLDIS